MMTDGKHVTGFFVRILRDGNWINLDIATLTDAELAAFFNERDNGNQWAVALARWIRDNVVSIDMDGA